ncbi:DUF885 domain-containing protein [Streptomyces sp. NPDC087440]|uniref:DUF885 domain-containing protein n=1 Tax=Streptomyces sp. NPDC087440 TaxID=3365790 RepID=UPI00382BCBC7
MNSARDVLPRQVADSYVDALVELNPIMGTFLGDAGSSRRLPDFSPDGQDGVAALARATLGQLARAEAAPGADRAAERRCARLMRERLTAELAVHEAGEGLRTVSNLSSPLHEVRTVFTLTPADTEDDWAAIAQRLRAVPGALAGYRAALDTGRRRGLPAGPRQVDAVIGQLDEWTGTGGRSWFAQFVEPGPETLRTELTAAAHRATGALGELRDWLATDYAPAVAGAPDTVGRERYGVLARWCNGADLDLEEAYGYGWAEFHRLHAEMRTQARLVGPGTGTPWEALAWCEQHGEVIEGVEETRRWLQQLMEEVMDALDGTHFDVAERVRRVESCIAPPGSAAAPYYTEPSLDFTRPGRTWLPTLGQNRFAVYDLVTTWYHEGVPGHHLQLAQWAHVADSLSRYQTMVGAVNANAEGWALYAERLMDELGFLSVPERRLGYLDAQMHRAVRVVIDIGMHLGLEIPRDAPFCPGERWTPALAQEFLNRHTGRPADYVDSEITRYLGMAGQAIGYKLGERVWLAGREAARARHGAAFDLKAWHMAALSQGSLGLDDLLAELSAL